MKDLKLRDYQTEAVKLVVSKIKTYGLCYLAGEVRTGKTLVAINAASALSQSVLFITKKKAIKSIENDLKNSGLTFSSFDIINYERIQLVDKQYGLVIYDEAHTMGAYPKPSQRTKLARTKFGQTRCLFLSGTPSPESFSQLYHQFYVSEKYSPWAHYKNFYSWAKIFVIPSKKYIRMGLTINDYSNAKESVVRTFDLFKVSMTQADANFNCDVVEKIHTLRLPDVCRDLIKELRKNKLAESRKLITDTGAKLMSAVHQISSGTYIDSDFENKMPDRRHILSDYKVEYIKSCFEGKLAIFYVYIAEGELLKKSFPDCTDNPEEFNRSTNKTFICQIQSGKEGINLATADHLIFFNISYSAVAYWQGRARTQSHGGGQRSVHWIFSDVGIENKIYRIVQGKKNFTKRHFNERDFDKI
jgi:hypothetical protein